MYKVMIVDDEPIIRYGIRACLDWRSLGLEVIGEHANGEEAYAAMQADQPDILITDIKMPLMDGIALTRKAMALQPSLKVVFVSSYNDYEFVREGIRLGAVDYLLKPTMEPSELEALMVRCIELLDREREVRRHLSLADRKAREELRRQWEQEIRRSLLDETAPCGQERLPDWMAEPVLTACILLDHTRCLDETKGFMHKTILLEDVHQAWYACCPLCVALIAEPEGLMVIMPQQGHASEALNSLEACKTNVEKQCGVSLTAGVLLHQDRVPWAERFRLARQAAAKRFFSGTGKVHLYETPSAAAAGLPAGRNLRKPEPAGTTEPDDLLPDEMHRELNKHLARWQSGRYSESDIKADACSLLARWAGGTDTSLQLSGMERINRCETLDELAGVLKQLGEACTDASFHPSDSGGSSLAEKALKYMQEHFTDELTLQEVADHVHVSRNYFSHLFKKHTGRNFIDYLIHLRIRHARKLLTDKNLRIYEVAEQSGFRDVKYFSKLFRRVTGMSPQEFRVQAEEEKEP